MASKTNLDIMDLAGIFQALSQSRRTGTLSVSDMDQVIRHIHFEEGMIQMVATPEKDFVLTYLRKSNLVLDEVLNLTVKKTATSDITPGQCLLDEGLIDKEDLEKALKWGCMEELCALFEWEEIHSEFQEAYADETLFPPEYLIVDISINPNSVIMEAARQMDEIHRLMPSIASLQDVPRMLDAVRAEYLDENEPDLAEVLRHINGKNDLEDIVKFAKLGRLRTLQILAKLAKEVRWRYLNADQLGRLVVRFPRNRDKRVRLLERASEIGEPGNEYIILLAANYKAQGREQDALQKYLAYISQARTTGNLQGAVEAYQKITNLKPDSIEYREDLLEILRELGDRAGCAKVYMDMAEISINQQDTAHAVQYLNELIELDPENHNAREKLLAILQAAHETPQAIMVLEQTAAYLRDKGKIEDAIKTFRRILAIDRECIEAHLEMAKLIQETGRTDEAVREYQTLADMLSSSGVFKESGTGDFLIHIYEKIVQLVPDNTLARQWLADAYAKQNQINEALAHYNELADILYASGESEGYIDACYAIVGLAPDHPQYRIRLGRALKENGRLGAAKMEYLQAGRRLLKSDDIVQAEPIFELLLEMDAFDVEVHTGLARIAKQKNDKLLAAQRYMNAGLLCSGAGYYERAIEMINLSLEMNTDNDWLRQHLDVCLEKAGAKRS